MAHSASDADTGSGHSNRSNTGRFTECHSHCHTASEHIDRGSNRSQAGSSHHAGHSHSERKQHCLGRCDRQ
jgi:hypothetical protein